MTKASGYKCFVSNELVLYNTLISASLAALFAFVFVFDENSLLLGVGVFLFFFTFVFCAERNSAPFAYKRIRIDSCGVRCGKAYVAYSDIEKISVARGRVKEWWGYRFTEEHYFRPFEALQLPLDVYVEDMLCFNCNFVGFKKEKATRGRVYVPQNKKTDAILRKYCDKYAGALELEENKLLDVHTTKKRKIVLDFIQCFSFFCLLPSVILTVILLANDSFNLSNTIRLLCVFLLGSLCSVLNIMKYYNKDLRKRKISRQL